jgi:hypothetical protein
MYLAHTCRMRCCKIPFRVVCGLFQIGSDSGRSHDGPYATLSNPMPIPYIAVTCRMRCYRTRFQPVHPLHSQLREFLPRSSSRARSSLSILSAGSLENSFSDPGPEPVPACPSSPQLAFRIPTQIQLQSPFPPVHPISRQPREFLPGSSSRARSSLSILSSPQPASRSPSQIHLQSPD